MIFGPFGKHLGSILGTFLEHFGQILGGFSHTISGLLCGHILDISGAFWPQLGTKMPPRSNYTRRDNVGFLLGNLSQMCDLMCFFILMRVALRPTHEGEEWRFRDSPRQIAMQMRRESIVNTI